MNMLEFSKIGLGNIIIPFDHVFHDQSPNKYWRSHKQSHQQEIIYHEAASLAIKAYILKIKRYESFGMLFIWVLSFKATP